jgi:hypothetical protein
LWVDCTAIGENKKRKERSGIAWLIAGIWQQKEVRRNADKGRCPLCFEKEDVKHILLECKQTKYWREKLIHDKWLNMNKESGLQKNSQNNKYSAHTELRKIFRQLKIMV